MTEDTRINEILAMDGESLDRHVAENILDWTWRLKRKCRVLGANGPEAKGNEPFWDNPWERVPPMHKDKHSIWEVLLPKIQKSRSYGVTITADPEGIHRASVYKKNPDSDKKTLLATSAHPKWQIAVLQAVACAAVAEEQQANNVSTNAQPFPPEVQGTSKSYRVF